MNDRQKLEEGFQSVLDVLGNDMHAMAFKVAKDCPVVTLCGSTRFAKEFAQANQTLTMWGAIVLAPGMFAQAPDDADVGAKADFPTITAEQKDELDALHLAKIDRSQFIHVLNVDGYIGHSTAREIMFAYSLGLPITWSDTERIPSLQMVCLKAFDKPIDNPEDYFIKSPETYPWDKA